VPVEAKLKEQVLVTAPSNSQLPWFNEPQTLRTLENRPAKAVFLHLRNDTTSSVQVKVH